MRAYCTLVRRELGTFFKSWMGYIVLAVTTLVLGGCFVLMLWIENGNAENLPLTLLFYDTQFFWFILLVMPAVITMRSFALEKSTGTYETLMTTPVGDAQVVLAKFTGGLMCFLLIWLPLLPCLLIARHYSSDPSGFTAGTMAATGLGIGLFGSAYIAIGVFASAVTRSQIIAVIVGLAIGGTLFTCIFLDAVFPSQGEGIGRLVAYLALHEHMRNFAQGVVDVRPVVLYLSLTVLFLLLTWKAVECRRWK